jgi:hypothetical protein
MLCLYLCGKQTGTCDFCNSIDVHKSAHMAGIGHHNTKNTNVLLKLSFAYCGLDQILRNLKIHEIKVRGSRVSIMSGS